jgi:hypothetical protein
MDGHICGGERLHTGARRKGITSEIKKNSQIVKSTYNGSNGADQSKALALIKSSASLSLGVIEHSNFGG